MPKDFKIGIIFGLLIVASAVVWLSTRKDLSVESRMLNNRQGELNGNEPVLQPVVSPANPVSTNIKPAALTEVPQKSAALRFHTIIKGETLSDISKIYYGSSNKWRKILDANRDVIKDENKLKTGTRLVIPD